MAITASKPAINIREKLSELDQPQGIKGTEVLRADTADEARNAIGARGRKNLLINGGFDVWQRGVSHAAGTAGGITYTTDRWWRYGGGSGTLEKSTDAPSGFANSFYVNSTTSLTIGTTVELPRLGYFPQQVMTFSMYVKGSFINNIIFNFRNVSGSGTDQVAISTQSQAGFYSEWTRLSFTVDTTGITPHANNTALNIEMGMQVGCRITGVQLEVGDQATEFEHRSYGEELALCQRYYEQSPSLSGFSGAKQLLAISTVALGGFHFLQTKRATPLISVYSRSGAVGKVSDMSTGGDSASVVINTIGTTAFHYVSGSGFVVGHLYEANYTADAEL